MKVRRRKYKSGRVAFQLDLGEVNGRRVQRSFETKTEANEELAKERKKRAAHGDLGGSLLGEELAEIVAAKSRLRDCGASIPEAVEFYLKHATRLREEITVPELVKRFRADRQDRGKSERYVGQLGVSLGNLGKFYPLKKAHEVTQHDIEMWLLANAWKGKTFNNYLGDVAAMFEWACGKTRGHARMNPTTEIERMTWKGKKITALDVERCQQLLDAAAEEKQWRVLVYVVLGMLGGIRPAEIERLKWDAIDLDERTVIVLATDAKTAARRVVDLTVEAVEWLRLIPAALREGDIIKDKGWEDEWVIFRRELGWNVGRGKRHLAKSNVESTHGRWPHDALRHTFASMHYAKHKNEALLQVQLGHRSARMLHQHYRAVVTPAEAELFWSLRPSQTR